MKKIALEEHFLSPELSQYSEADFVSFAPDCKKTMMQRLYDFEQERLEAMDKAGIEISVLSHTDPGVQRVQDSKLAVQLARNANDFLAEKIQRYPKRYRGFAHLAMQDPLAAAKELERAVKDLHFVGALINGQTGGHYLDEERYYPFWERVEELGVPIYIHPGAPYQLAQNYIDNSVLEGAVWGWTVETATHALRLVFRGLFDRFPKIKIILGHMGETLPYLLWRFDSRWNIMKHEVKLLKKPSEYIKQNFYITTSGVCANEPLVCAINALGEDRVMFSVDYPYEYSDIAADFIEKAPLKNEILEKVCYKNAAQLLKI